MEKKLREAKRSSAANWPNQSRVRPQKRRELVQKIVCVCVMNKCSHAILTSTFLFLFSWQ